jgi:hypothetical protein
MNVADSGSSVPRVQHRFARFRSPIARIREWIGWNIMHIPGTPQFVYVPRCSVVVQFVLIDGLAHDKQILPQHGFLCVQERPRMLSVKHPRAKN